MSEHDHVPILDDLGDLVEGTANVATTAVTSTVDAATNTTKDAADGTADLIGLHPVKGAKKLGQAVVGVAAAPVVVVGKTVGAAGDAIDPKRKFRF